MAETNQTPRPTGKNAEQDAEIARLTAEVKALKAAQPAAPAARVVAALPPAEARKKVLAAFNKKPKTYRALQNGTDFVQGFIPEGAVFTTTQPQGSWMELVEDQPEADAE
jgi:hypothetical protein